MSCGVVSCRVLSRRVVTRLPRGEGMSVHRHEADFSTLVFMTTSTVEYLYDVRQIYDILFNNKLFKFMIGIVFNILLLLMRGTVDTTTCAIII